MFRLVLLVLLLTTIPTTTKADPYVIDGDTIIINNIHYRLAGIDAPESKQVCNDSWLAGVHATAYLRALIAHRQVRCTASGKDRYNRTIAICYADDKDLGSEMVRAGYAYAYETYSKRYIVEQAFAKQEGRGVHMHNCEYPWIWRKEHK